MSHTINMDRYWLLTTRAYGTWLPGDERGFVGWVQDPGRNPVKRNQPNTPTEPANRPLWQAARSQMKLEPMSFTAREAELLLEQFLETAAYRAWQLLAVSVLTTHVHAVLGVPGDPDPEELLRDFKAYGSRKLNQHSPRGRQAKWWSESGSRRKLPEEKDVLAAIQYVLRQECPLLIWSANIPELGLPQGRVV
jgi:REP element-mobilizing transposase RayT